MKLLLLNKKVHLKKYPGKGGWTYALLPNVIGSSSNPFGWVLVDAVIDNIEVKNMKLMAIKNGKLFLPFKAELRRKIGKEAGQSVDVKIYANNMLAE